MGFGKSKSDKKKGPKGKKARAKAKLDRRWGETTIQDDENQTRRIGKSRLLAKSQDRSSVRFGEKSTERQKVQTSSTGILRNREGSKEQTYYSSRKRHDDDDSSFSDSDNDSDLEIEITPLSNLLSSIKQSSKKKGKSKKGERTNFDPESDDEEAEMEEDNSGEDEMEEDEESLSENGETENLDNGVEIDDDDDDADDDSVLVTENGVGGDREPALDLFRQRFSSIAMSESELENASPLTTKIPIERSHELHLSTLSKEKSDIFLDGLLPTSKNSKRSSGEWQEITEQSFSGNRKVLQRQWKRVNKTKLMTDHQASIYPFLTRYTDLLVTTESRKYRNEMHKMYLLHVLNHVLTSRGRIQRHNREIKEQEKKKQEDSHCAESIQDVHEDDIDSGDDDRFRDQGFTRPTVLVLLPTRGTCYRFVTEFSKFLGLEIENDPFQERFEADYGVTNDEDDAPLGEAAERRRKAVLEQKGKTWNELFGDEVNQDDDFKMGIALTPKAAIKKNTKQQKGSNVAVKLYTDFYKSDIIVASPLGLKMLVAPSEDGKDGNSDFLSSIEICLMEDADVLLMQNWDHVNDILSMLNQEPQSNNDTDFSRVRSYMLEGQAANWRQLIFSSNIVDPSLVSSFKRFGKSVSGSVKMRRKVLPEDASIANVIVPIKQVFQKVPLPSFDKQSEARVNYFVKTILPQILRHNQKHTMVYVPSYFDFVSLRNIFLKRELSFVSVTEYSRETEVSRGRARFLQGRKPIMLFTGRCNFFLRHAIKGVRHLIFLGLPEHPEFYADQVNLVNHTTNDETDIDAATLVSSCLALFTRYEAHALERIVGSGNCSRMLSSQKSTFMFQI